jgi:preprotein translocase SecE subunit
MSLFSYFQETQAELRHVAWPTRVQTIVYTALVIAISVFIALYLGFFDFLFTSTLARLAGVQRTPAPTEQTNPVTVSTSSISTSTPVNFNLPTTKAPTQK